MIFRACSIEEIVKVKGGNQILIGERDRRKRMERATGEGKQDVRKLS